MSTHPKRVLVTWGTKLGGTEGIGRIVGEVLRREGFDVTEAPASKARDVGAYDAVVLGGALYANLWHSDARRFVARNLAALRRIPVWFFSSGPLDDSAEQQKLPPTKQVAVLMERIGALGHETFGGRLVADAKGFPAASMAKKLSGDWRNPERIRAWAADVARALPDARPQAAIEHPAGSLGRLLVFGVTGWTLSALLLAGLLAWLSTNVAIGLHAVAAPLVFAGIAVRYFAGRGARDPLPTALAFTGVVLVLDAGVVAGLVQRSPAMLTSIGATWLPAALIFLVTWMIGFLMSTMPWPMREDAAKTARAQGGNRGGHDASPRGV